MHNLENKVSLVTGGASGIGAAIVKAFLKEGAKVIILDINEDGALNMVAEMAAKYTKDKIQFIKCDVTQEDQLIGAFEKVNNEHGYIDVIVNNAGIADESLPMYRKEIDLNMTAVVSATFRGLEMMRKDRGGRGGTIINVSSICGLKRISPGLFLYGAIKSALIHFGSSIGMDRYFSKTNVRVITICFGTTETNIIAASKSFDGEINGNSVDLLKHIMVKSPMQSAEAASRGVVESYKNGKSGSVWLVNNSKIYDISEDVDQAYDILENTVKA